jgi:phage terminase small subunit
MNRRMQRFVEEYLVDLNAARAARRAGYSGGYGRKLVHRSEVAEAITTAMNERSRRTGISADEVVLELARIGRANLMDYITVQADGTAYVDLTDLDREQAAALAEITVDEYAEGRGAKARAVKRVRIKLMDKRAALVDLGRHLGMFGTRPEPSDGEVARATDGEIEARIEELLGRGDA